MRSQSPVLAKRHDHGGHPDLTYLWPVCTVCGGPLEWVSQDGTRWGSGREDQTRDIPRFDWYQEARAVDVATLETYG